jgi:hypothetical protein
MVIPLGTTLHPKSLPDWLTLISDFCFHLLSHRQIRLKSMKTKIPQLATGAIWSAEKEGFEPPDPWKQINGFQDRRIRPLCHFSAAKIIFF